MLALFQQGNKTLGEITASCHTWRNIAQPELNLRRLILDECRQVQAEEAANIEADWLLQKCLEQHWIRQLR